MKTSTITKIVQMLALGIYSVGILSSCSSQTTQAETTAQAKEAAQDKMPTIMAELTDAPNVPAPITRKHAAKVVVKLEVTEVVKRMADGVDYTFWTFGGSVPGKFIRIRQNDEVEFHLMNHPDSKNPVSGPISC